MRTRLFYAFHFLRSFVLIYPIYLLLFEAKGLALPQISLLLAVWSAPVVILELPTGILADHWSRKNMLVLGTLIHGACYGLWFFAEGFLLFALGFVLWGIGEAITSGSGEALLYDSLKSKGQEDDFDRVYGRCRYYASLGVGLAMLLGGFMASAFGMRTVLALSVLSLSISAVLASRLPEVNLYKQNSKEDGMAAAGAEGGAMRKALATLTDAARFLAGKRLLTVVVLLFILVIGTAGMLDEYDQMIVHSFGLSMGLVGVWGFLRCLLEAAGSRAAYRVKALLFRLGVKDPFYAVWLLCVLAGASAALAGWAARAAFAPVYVLFYFLMSIAGVLAEDYLQQRIEEQGRSTVHSIVSLLMNLYGVAFFGLFAFVFAGLPVFDILLYTSVYILGVCLLLAVLYSLLKTRKE